MTTTDTAFLIIPIDLKTFFPPFRGKLTSKSLKNYLDRLEEKFHKIQIHSKDIPLVLKHLYRQSLKKTKKSLKKITSNKEVQTLHEDLKKMVKFMRSLV